MTRNAEADDTGPPGVCTVNGPLVAPAGTVSARYQIVFRQPQTAAGALLFDDLRLTLAPAAERPVAVSVNKAGPDLDLSFRTFLGLAYQVRFKNELSDAAWLVLADATGDGATNVISDVASAPQRFYHAACLCDLTE